MRNKPTLLMTRLVHASSMYGIIYVAHELLGKFAVVQTNSHILVTGSHLDYTPISNPLTCIMIILIVVQTTDSVIGPVTWQQSILTFALRRLFFHHVTRSMRYVRICSILQHVFNFKYLIPHTEKDGFYNSRRISPK